MRQRVFNITEKKTITAITLTENNLSSTYGLTIKNVIHLTKAIQQHVLIYYRQTKEQGTIGYQVRKDKMLVLKVRTLSKKFSNSTFTEFLSLCTL